MSNERPSASEDERACRICYGADSRDDPLFQPCNCTGSMAYIHVSCLETWRSTSANANSFYQCDTCKFKYVFGRRYGDQLLLARLLGSTLAIHALDYELHPPGNPCREQPARHDVPKRVRNRTAAVVCLATWHANAAAKRAREATCAAAPPPPDPVRIFTLATTCAKGVAAFHSNG